jgi:RimJ/RimL family protein N-acetyltransferase
MFTQEIICSKDIKLVKPDVERDAPVAVGWFEGERGIKTLRQLGNIVTDDFKPTLNNEKKQIQKFLGAKDQLNWMIKYGDKIVGSVWADLAEKNGCLPPSVHILIGDESVRGKGVGTMAEGAVLDYLISNGESPIYSRTLVSNERMMHIAIDKLGYKKDGEVYTDKDGLTWQNLIKEQR